MFFTSEADRKKCDATLKDLCCGQENCRRSTLLKGLGSTEQSSVGRERCCDSCNSHCPYESLVLTHGASGSKRKKQAQKLRVISTELAESLEDRLVHERDSIIESSAAMVMLPKSVVCPINVIKEVCTRSKFVSSVDDIRAIPGLRSEFHSVFLTSP